MRPLPADETLALRRLRVAIRQRDPRKLAIAIEHLAEDLDNGARYARVAEWGALSDSAMVELDLSPGLQARVSEVVSRIVGKKPPPPQPVPVPTAGRGVLAIVAAWDGALASEQSSAACLRVLDRSTSSSVGQLRGWLGTGASVEAVASRANALLSAAHLGALDRPPPWMDALVAGIQAACATPDEDRCGYRGLSPSLNKSDLPALHDCLKLRPGGGVLTSHVGLDWEELVAAGFGSDSASASASTRWSPPIEFRRLAYDPDDFHLVKLAGSLDWFYCFRCVELAESAGSPLAIACPRCGGPCWPLVAPPGNPYFSPAPLRDVWAAGERVVAQAETWLVVDPPSPRASDPVVRWLMRRWTPDKRVVVVSRHGPTLESWRSAMERQGALRVATGMKLEPLLGELIGAGPSKGRA
jgi:hypothetical protein